MAKSAAGTTVKKKTAKSSSKSKKKKLLIVESPAKADTIQKYLGSGYIVRASMGHVIDLPKSRLGVDVDNDFEPRYITIRGKGQLLTQLKKEAAKASKVYLATDPDREGEAISWHLAHALDIDVTSECRVTFNEITKTAVKAAVEKPRAIDMDLVNAQQARRVLDRIVGYQISPILWEKVKKGLSAGRVQSVATRLICDREEEIENFTPEEYWTIEATMTDPKSKKSFAARYYGENGKETKIVNGTDAERIAEDVRQAEIIAAAVKRGTQKRSPYPPFTTSTLQQDAAKKLNFAAAKTMQAAQILYEGVNLGGKLGSVGLITYMRTDSQRIAKDAQDDAVRFISESYGEKYAEPKQFKTKKSAQDAHEAIRPTSVALTPESVKAKLTNDQYKLYKLIWERFVASQMPAAVYETMNVSINAGTHTFRASGSHMVFDGFRKVYDTKEKEEKMLPPIDEGEKLTLKSIAPKQHFTQPPPRYNDASLVKALEENGIGRPSTYAPTISTIVSRGYVTRNKTQLMPTELGMVTTDIMKNNFSNIVDVDFTAGMESKLDKVEEGGCEWKTVLEDFYPDFKESLDKAHENIDKVTIKDEVSDVKCEKCGRMMVYKLSKYGKFLACPGYPECKNTKAIRNETGVKCPKCGGEILERKSKKGKTYYACEHVPRCDFMAWDRPLRDEKCPQCGGILYEHKGKNARVFCTNEDCGYKRKLDK